MLAAGVTVALVDRDDPGPRPAPTTAEPPPVPPAPRVGAPGPGGRHAAGRPRRSRPADRDGRQPPRDHDRPALRRHRHQARTGHRSVRRRGPRRPSVWPSRTHASRPCASRGIEPLVTFFRSSRGKAILPTPEEYRRHFRLFRQRYPWVRLFSTWNEANFTAQPTSRDPARTARFYRIARQECSGGRCEVLTCDFRPDGRERSARWLATFKRGIGPGPHRWGLSSYVDVNRRSTPLTRDFLRNTEGPVWVNEVGAINFFGKGLAPDQNRQTRVMSYLMGTYPRVSPRLERLYVYHWRAAPDDTLFDSGLLDVEGRPDPPTTCCSRPSGGRRREAAGSWRLRPGPRWRSPPAADPMIRPTGRTGAPRCGTPGSWPSTAAARWSAWPTTARRHLTTCASSPRESTGSGCWCPPTTSSPRARAARSRTTTSARRASTARRCW